MNDGPYTPDQLDALGEMVNIAMGQAGACLGRLLDTYVGLSVPRTRVVTADEAARAVGEMTDGQDAHTVVRQSFFSAMRGEAMVLFGPGGGVALADLLGHEDDPGEKGQEELLLDVSNILVGAVLNGLSQQIGGSFCFNPPAIMARNAEFSRLLQPSALGWNDALLIEVNFAVEARDFVCHLILLMPEDAIDCMRGVLDRVLAAL